MRSLNYKFCDLCNRAFIFIWVMQILLNICDYMKRYKNGSGLIMKLLYLSFAKNTPSFYFYCFSHSLKMIFLRSLMNWFCKLMSFFSYIVLIYIGRYCHKVVTLFRAEKLSNKIVSGTGHLWLFRLFYLHRKHYLQRNSNKICSWKWMDRSKQKQKHRFLSGMSPHFNLDESFQVVVWQTARKQKVLHTTLESATDTETALLQFWIFSVNI